jgi:hypothetical protein
MACEWWETANGSKMLIEPDPQGPMRGEGDTVDSGLARTELFPRNHFDRCEKKGQAPDRSKPKPAASTPAAAAPAEAAKPAGPTVLWRIYSALTLYKIGDRRIERIRLSPKGAPEISEAERNMIRNVAKIDVVEDPSIEKGFFRIDPDWREAAPDGSSEG